MLPHHIYHSVNMTRRGQRAVMLQNVLFLKGFDGPIYGYYYHFTDLVVFSDSPLYIEKTFRLRIVFVEISK